MTPAEYLAFEDGPASGDSRHEYVDGRLIPMIGGTLAPDQFCINLLVFLGNRLKGSDFRVYTNAVKVRIDAANAYYYADVAVGRGRGDAQSTLAPNPVLIVEVLSPGTQGRDRREKLPNYQSLPYLEEILLVQQSARAVDVFRRQPSGWQHLVVKADGIIRLESIGLDLPLDTLYDDLEGLG